METDQSRSDEQDGAPQQDDEDVEEFKEEMENDPSRAASEGDTALDRLRGG